MNFMKPLSLTPILAHMMLAGMILLMLLLPIACSPAAATSTSVMTQETQTTLLPTATLEPTLNPTIAPTATPAEELVYPYYLPLATKLEDVSQTIGDVTLRIERAYVDEGRVAIQYTISGLDWPDGSMMDGMQQVQMSIPAIGSFRSGGFSGGSAVNVGPAQQGVIIASSDQALYAGALDAEKYAEVNVRVVIPVEGPTKVGNFHLNFTIPVLNGFNIDNIDQEVVANDVSMTLKSVNVNPAHVDARICFQMPFSVDWGLMTSVLTINGKDYPVSGGGLAQEPNGQLVGDLSTYRCNDIGFDKIPDETATSLTITVPRLQASVNEVITREVIDQANQRLADKGIQFDYVAVDHGGNFEILKRPEGATDSEIYPLIWDALANQYDGPWVFTVQIPN